MKDSKSDAYITAFNDLGFKLFGISPINSKIIKLVKISKLTVENLIIAIYLLYKFLNNNVVAITDKKLIQNLIIMSFILSNKLFNDQSYTFKTWINLIEVVKIPINMKMLKQLEIFFLNCLDYKLDYKFIMNDEKLWLHLELVDLKATKLFRDWLATGMTEQESTTCTPIIGPITPQDSPIVEFNSCYNENFSVPTMVPTPIYTIPSVPIVPVFPNFIVNDSKRRKTQFGIFNDCERNSIRFQCF